MTRSAAEEASEHRSPWRSPRALAVLIGTVTFGLATDLVSKWAAFRFIADVPVVVERERVLSNGLAGIIPPHEPIVVVPKLLEFTLVLNPGAVFGAGAGKRWLFIGFTGFALVFACWIFGSWTRSRDWVAHTAIGLLVAGGVGNLYDRLMFACVRDFLHPLPGMPLPFGLTWPSGSRDVWPYVSNIADLWLIVGIAVLLVYTWVKPVESQSASTGTKAR